MPDISQPSKRRSFHRFECSSSRGYHNSFFVNKPLNNRRNCIGGWLPVINKNSWESQKHPWRACAGSQRLVALYYVWRVQHDISTCAHQHHRTWEKSWETIFHHWESGFSSLAFRLSFVLELVPIGVICFSAFVLKRINTNLKLNQEKIASTRISGAAKNVKWWMEKRWMVRDFYAIELLTVPEA